MLTEYLYIDEARLNTYFEQISSPITIDRVPTWNAGISLTGPRAGATQAGFARPFTLSEKVAKLTRYLEENEQLATARPELDERPFVIETCGARRVFIPPPNHEQVPGSSGLSLWVSPPFKDPNDPSLVGGIYLFEGQKESDEQYPQDWSEYTTFELFDPLIRRDPNIYDAAKVYDTRVYDAMEDAFMTRFAAEPFTTLAQLGARIGPHRKIRTLYRIRAIFEDSGSRTGIYGYPIFIAAL